MDCIIWKKKKLEKSSSVLSLKVFRMTPLIFTHKDVFFSHQLNMLFKFIIDMENTVNEL